MSLYISMIEEKEDTLFGLAFFHVVKKRGGEPPS
jgi:hypothetical protein